MCNVKAAQPHLVDSFDFRNIGDSIGSVSVIVGFNLSLKEEDKLTYVESEQIQNALVVLVITCLFCVAFRVLHIDQDLSTSSFKRFHSEHSWL